MPKTSLRQLYRDASTPLDLGAPPETLIRDDDERGEAAAQLRIELMTRLRQLLIDLDVDAPPNIEPHPESINAGNLWMPMTMNIFSIPEEHLAMKVTITLEETSNDASTHDGKD